MKFILRRKMTLICLEHLLKVDTFLGAVLMCPLLFHQRDGDFPLLLRDPFL